MRARALLLSVVVLGLSASAVAQVDAGAPRRAADPPSAAVPSDDAAGAGAIRDVGAEPGPSSGAAPNRSASTGGDGASTRARGRADPRPGEARTADARSTDAGHTHGGASHGGASHGGASHEAPSHEAPSPGQDDGDDDGERPDDDDERVDGEEEDVRLEVSEDVVGTLGEAIGQLGTALGPSAPAAGRVHWNPSWPRYRFDELVVSLGMSLIIGLEQLLPTRGDANFSDLTDLDRAGARALGLDDPRARDIAHEVSNALVTALFLWPSAVDSLLYAGLGEGAWDVAWQLSLISLEVFTVNHALTVLVRLLGRRERPVGVFCAEEAGYDADPLCADQPPAQSFWSSHVSNAFAGAAMVCMTHDVLDLFGDEATDMMACGTALAAAATTGMLRIMSDRHWTTDVLTGAVVGSLSGILIPWLLHFQGGARPPLHGAEPPTISVMPMMGEDEIGLSAQGVWW